jgi:hypothetical protein
MNEETKSLLTKPWQKFFARFTEIDTLKTCKWQEIHLLAYIAKRFKQHYGREFSFSIKNAPSKCQEIVLVKRMSIMLGTTNPKTIKEYIDWVFDNKIIHRKMQIKTLAYFITPGFGNEFHFQREKNNKIDRTTELPNEYLTIAEEMSLPVRTYGDLAFAYGATVELPNDDSRAPYKELLQKLYAIGLDQKIFEEIK